MINFFKPEDFDLILSGRPPEVLKAVIEISNAKLEREGKVMYQSAFGKVWLDREDHTARKINTGLLINIEPVEICTHPTEKIVLFVCEYSPVYKCTCGKTVTPSGFEE